MNAPLNLPVVPDSSNVDVGKDTSSYMTSTIDQPILPLPASPVPLLPSKFDVGYIYSSEMMSHLTPDDYPEQPARIQRIWTTLVLEELTRKMNRIPIREARKDEVLLVHSEDHWNKVMTFQYMSDQHIADSEEYYDQMSLCVMSGTTRAALFSCGGVIEACLAVARNELKKTFAIVRPPGHHAEPNEHMGFCFFNNVAVAAKVVQQRTSLKKIMILDWDVHHGNGTQRAFNEDPSVLYVSLHRYEEGMFYPGGPFGSMTSCGEGPGAGFSVNIPWPEKGMGDAEYIYAFQQVVMPIAMEFSPELVIISAGFDSATGDELGGCLVSPAGYGHMTYMLSRLAGGRLVVALEGGYNLDSISWSALAVTRILLGDAPDALPPLKANEAATETVWQVAREQSKYWHSIDPKACEPYTELEPMTSSIPEILKSHRERYLYTEHDMMQVPILTREMQERFSSQVVCTSDVFESKTLIVFVHEFGNLRIELESSTTCDVNEEFSYLIEYTKELVGWAKYMRYALLDVNLFPKPVVTKNVITNSRKKTGAVFRSELLTYLWDNYIQISNADNVFFIGYGPACKPLLDLVSRRGNSVAKRVKGVVQVLGDQTMPATTGDAEDVRAWYEKYSLVIVPSNHPFMGRFLKPKDTIPRQGRILPIDETRQIKLIIRAMPSIKDFVGECLSTYSPSDANKEGPMISTKI